MLGLGYVRKERWVSLIFAVTIVTFLGNGILWTVMPAFVRGTLGGSAQFYRWIRSAQGAGGIAAGIMVGWVMQRLSPGHLLTWGLLLLGLLDLVVLHG